MRISDWSSDVCSSDLPPLQMVRRERTADCAAVRARAPGGAMRDLLRRTRFAGACARWRLGRTTGDRKSVVSGKSVSVRVDLGGRRIIKKKNAKYTRNYDTSSNSR